MTYKRFKELLLEKFAGLKITLGEYFGQEQGPVVSIDEFIGRMDIMGKRLRQTGEVRI
jgi:hypothetical protein